MSRTTWLCAALLGGLAAGMAQAQDNVSIITVRVTVNATPCQINNNQIIEVNFGENVITTEVAKGIYEQEVDYSLDCTNADQRKTLVMRISGDKATFGNNVLGTSFDELGVKLKADGQDFPLNTGLLLASSASKPVLSAQLVQKPDTRLPTGRFTAGATMTVDYQ